MTPFGLVCAATVLLAIMQDGAHATKTVFCSFFDEMYMAQRHEPPTPPPPRTGIYAEGNMANKIKTHGIDPRSYGEVLKDNKTIQCPESRDFCYTLWEGDHLDSRKVTIIKQGCWDQSDQDSCLQPGCVARSAINRKSNNTHFCCCTGLMCNVNVTSEYVLEEEPTPNLAATPRYQILPDPNYRYRTIIIALASVAGVAMVIALSYLMYRLLLGSHKHPYEPEHLVEVLPTPMMDLEQLKLCSLLSGGRYGDVWKGTLYDTDVAVKLFMPVQKQYFINERDIYSLPHMDHPALLRYYGSDERMNQDGVVPYSIIVMDYVPRGTLCHYLKEQTFDWNQMCRLGLSAASGLAHLHTDILLGDKEKPAIAHRDFNSRNILIKEDLTCCICDFGFAMKILGSKFIRNGFEEIAEQSPISDVGTLRYMAPEVLDGAVNLRDCEASLKQIDVYALGLVLWEIASRCSDLYQGMPVPEYKLPFEADLGPHPTFEEMQRHVSWKRGRPAFPDVWKDSNQVLRALKETIEDSWDQDAEARLTSLCVEERIHEMTTMWDMRNKVGITPTNPVTLISTDQIVRNQTSDAPLNGDAQNTDTTTGNTSMPSGTLSNVININDLNLPPGVTIQRNSCPENSVSGSTIETTLTGSPSDPMPLIEPPGKTSNLLVRPKQPLQPHQGQNPTVERNTHKRSDDKLVVLGNTLVDQSVAEEARDSETGDRAAVTGNTNANFTDDLFEVIADNLESSLVQNDLLGQQQYPTPSAQQASNLLSNSCRLQLQNNPAEPLVAQPKQPNVPGNGSAYHPPVPQRAFPSQPEAPQASQTNHQPKQRSKFRFKKPTADKISGKMSGLYQFGKNLLRGGGHDSSSDEGANYFPTENLLNPAQMTSKTSSTSAAAATSCSTDIDLDNPGKSNLEPRQVLTEVCLMNGGATVVRPMSLPGVDGKDFVHNYNTHHSESSSEAGSDQETVPKYCDTAPVTATEPHRGLARVGDAKQEVNSLVSAKSAPHKMKLRSQSSFDLSPTGNSLIDMSEGDDKLIRRPNSLSVNGHNYKKAPLSVPCLNNLGCDDADAGEAVTRPLMSDHQRPQSSLVPQLPPASRGVSRDSGRQLNQDGRYSLCDDRPLSHSVGDVNSMNKQRERQSRRGPGQSSISLTQFASAEQDMNTLHQHQQPADYPC